MCLKGARMGHLFSAVGFRPHRAGTKAVNKKHFANASDPRSKKIELMWHLFNAWPNNAPRLQKARSAAQRIDSRQNIRATFPTRQDFKSTAEYYDAVMPLLLARSRFITMLKPNSFLLGVHSALSRIALKTQTSGNFKVNR